MAGLRTARWVGVGPTRAGVLTLVLGLFMALGAGLVGSAATAAGTGTRIAHIESDGRTLNVLVDVPADTDPDLAKVSVKIGGTSAKATATKASGATTVSRTAILAIDTSNSMKGARFEAAKSAARLYLDSVPADVRVGIVTFADKVVPALSPGTDRDAARAVIDGLTLTKQTVLYAGIEEAVRLAGTEGQRTVLVLSDGADTSGDPIQATLGTIKDADITVDVVALDQKSNTALAQLASAGEGRVVEAGTTELGSAFAAEAEVLSRQVLVTAQVPSGLDSSEANVTVALPSASGQLTASSFTQISSPDAAPPEQASGSGLPSWVQWAGLTALGLGLLLVLGLLLPSLAPAKLTTEDRISAYTDRSRATKLDAGPQDQLATAKETAARFLAHNATLDERIRRRLDHAGSELRSSEWLVIHVICVVVAILLGALVGGGSFLVMLLFMALGVLGPWLYLGYRRGKRVKQFNAALPDTLQLLSGSLAAGLSLAQSVDTIVQEGSEPMAGEFRRVLIEARLGVSIEDALEGVTERFASKDFAWVVMAIRIQRQVGGNLAELLDTVAGTIREREYLRRQVATLSAEGKMSAWVLGGLPPLFLLYLTLSQPDYVAPMFNTGMGIVMLLGAGLMLALGAFWMSRLVKVDV